MTVRAVVDTHAILWYLYDDPRLSPTAVAFLDAIEQARDQIAVSSITFAEMVYLVEKGRIVSSAIERTIAAIEQPDATLIETPFDRVIAEIMRRIDRNQVPDFPDRIIAATALRLEVPLISRDRKIQTSIVTTIW